MNRLGTNRHTVYYTLSLLSTICNYQLYPETYDFSWASITKLWLKDLVTVSYNDCHIAHLLINIYFLIYGTFIPILFKDWDWPWMHWHLAVRNKFAMMRIVISATTPWNNSMLPVPLLSLCTPAPPCPFRVDHISVGQKNLKLPVRIQQFS